LVIGVIGVWLFYQAIKIDKKNNYDESEQGRKNEVENNEEQKINESKNLKIE
jgi:hypothetical protein